MGKDNRPQQQFNKQPNNRNNNNNNRDNSYFAQKIKQNGENFQENRDAMRNFKNDTIRIFRDLARGKININVYQSYLLDPLILNPMIDVATENMNEYGLLFSAMNNMVNGMNMAGQPINPYIITILEKYRNKTELYSIIANNLVAFRNTSDVNYLIVLTNGIARFSNFI